MVKKTSVSSESSDQETKTKSKKRVVRKKKTETEDQPDFSVFPNNGGPVQMDSVIDPVAAESIHNRYHSLEPVDEEQRDEEKRDIMRDIKPRDYKHDATFLVPEKFGFELKPRHSFPKQGGLGGKLVWIISGLIVVLIIVFVSLSIYSNKVANNNSENVAIPSEQAERNQNTGTYRLAISNVPEEFKSPLTSLVQNKFKDQLVFADNSSTLPAVTKDTLFIKQAGQQLATDLLVFLASNGIKAEMQQADDLQAEAVLYLSSTVSNPDLSGLTAAAYNATGVSGLAKKNCDVLIKYKVTSCNALNATANQTGSTVTYKTEKALFVLKRTPEYATAKFGLAGADQVEDIRLMIGK
ncbi:MAG: hypothetical protein AAB351_03815 [Patescibacteria group bacterium]